MNNERMLGNKSREFIGPPERLEFKSPSGRDSTVEIQGKRYIGHGFWGNVYRARANILSFDNAERSKPYGVVLKTYDRNPARPDHASDSRLRAEYALRAYQEVRKAGVTTWVTYRLETTKPIILMSDGGEAHPVISPSLALDPIAGRSWSVDKDSFLKTRVVDIANLEGALRHSLIETRKAEKCGVRLPADAWFIRIKAKPDHEIDIELFVGDFDSVSWGVLVDADNQPDALQNISQLEQTIELFFREILDAGVISGGLFTQLVRRARQTIKNAIGDLE
jgi:hypothetical protein